MFHSKIFSILQNTVHRNLYKNGHSGIFALFSSNTGDVTLAESPSETTTTTEDTDTESFTDTSSPERPVRDKLYRKIEIEVRGHDPAVLRSYAIFSNAAAKHLDIPVSNVVSPDKPVHERLTLLKSVHVHKKHRVQYETRTYYKYFEVSRLTGSTADTYLEYIERNLPEGVAMKITKVELNTLPEVLQPAV